MPEVQDVLKYFPELTEIQKNQLSDLAHLYTDWNNKINVISRKDMDQFYVRHVLHSLGIAKVQPFLPRTSVLDVGTGGGFPGIPLAILFPETDFLLVDSIGKKCKVVAEVASALELKNVRVRNTRAETIPYSFDFIVSRAVTRMPEFLSWVRHKVKKKSQHELSNGILYLKGGDLIEEMSDIALPFKFFDLPNYFEEDFFETKKVVWVGVQ